MDEVKVERSKFIMDLLGEVDAMDESLFPATSKREDDEPILGECPLWGRKLYALGRMYGREVEHFKVEDKYDPNHDPDDENHVKMRVADSKEDLLNEMLWSSIRAELGLWTVENIGIRQGWLVVKPRATPHQVFRRIIEGMQGE